MDILNTIDISRSGLGVTTGQTYYPGQRLVVSLPLSETQGHRNIYATVVRSSRQDERRHIGLEFDSASVDAWCGVSGTSTAAA